MADWCVNHVSQLSGFGGMAVPPNDRRVSLLFGGHFLSSVSAMSLGGPIGSGVALNYNADRYIVYDICKYDYLVKGPLYVQTVSSGTSFWQWVECCSDRDCEYPFTRPGHCYLNARSVRPTPTAGLHTVPIFGANQNRVSLLFNTKTAGDIDLSNENINGPVAQSPGLRTFGRSIDILYYCNVKPFITGPIYARPNGAETFVVTEVVGYGA